MTDIERLAILKVDLEVMTNKKDVYLQQLLSTAASLISREGVTLADSIEDDMLQVMYAAYLYRKRAVENAPMPRMIRYALNNRLMAEKGAAPIAT